MTPSLRLFIAATALLVLTLSLVDPAPRWWRRRQLRKELQLLRGGKPRPIFTSYGELEERPPRPPIRSLRNRGDHDAA